MRREGKSMCQPLLQVYPQIEEIIQAAPRVSLFLDFDGTLSWVTEFPDEAHLDEQTLETLRRLSGLERIVTTIISGRAIEDLYSRIRLDGLIYAGNHGLEIFGKQFRFVEPGAAAHRESLGRISEDIAEELESVPGILVEYKGYSASIHYRQASDADVPKVEQAVRSTVAAASSQFRVNSGKKVFEVVPRTGWHKGMAVNWINSHLGFGGTLPIYVGDDSTDEDAFRSLPDAITVKVGDPTGTSAQYYLPDPAAVQGFLEWLAALA